MAISFHVGSRIPAYRSAIGRVLLAELPRADLEDYLRSVKLRRETPRTITRKADLRAEIEKVREEGHSIVDQEIELGILAAAVPVRIEGQPALGMSVTLQISRGSAETLRRDCVPVLHQAAEELRHVLHLRN